MSSTAAPFGLVPAYHMGGGVVRPEAFTILSGYATNILQNQPVKIVPSATGEGTLAAAAIGDRFIGSFQGVEYTDSEGRRRVTNRWTANTVATDIVAYATRDPQIAYKIQSNAALAVTDIGKQYDFSTISAGSTVTGISAIALDVASVAANAGVQLVNICPDIDNAWGDTYVNVFVRISEHQFVADVAAF